MRVLPLCCAALTFATACTGGIRPEATTRGTPQPEATNSSSPQLPRAGMSYRLVSVNSGLALDVSGDPNAHGAEIVQNANVDSLSQRWNLASDGNVYHLINSQSGMCLNVDYQSLDLHALLQQWDCNAGTSEQWTIEQADVDSFALLNVNSGKSMEVADMSKDPNHAVDQAYYVGSPSQKWVFAAVDANGPSGNANASSPSNPNLPAPAMNLGAGSIYVVYPEIFSPAGTFAAVTAQLTRIHGLGFSILYLMPVTPVGQPIGTHPAFDSPYCVQDFYGINAKNGTASDLKALVDSAHAIGMQVILDEVLNHSSWDNALITQHPEYYLHTDGIVSNPNSIATAFGFNDVAQFDYKTPGNGLAAYMTIMLQYWVTTYGIDGFRFDTASDPDTDQRMIPQTFWQSLKTSLQATSPTIIFFGEEENPQLALAPFALDYGWTLQSALKQTATSGNSLSGLQSAYEQQKASFPAGMLHANLLQDWDLDEDLRVYGGPANTMAAALFNFTIDGVPMLFNGEEVANDASANNTHTQINWQSSQAGQFSAFYASLLALRNSSTALQQGSLAWVNNTAADAVLTYERSDATGRYLVEINFSSNAISGTLSPSVATSWQEVTPTGAPGGSQHTVPTSFNLGAFDFAVFRAL